MERPQRHRLLHGYPLAAAMPILKGDEPAPVLEHDPSRTLLVGVLPHPFCSPAVAGCGFCTFPHERFDRRGAESTIADVIREIDARLSADPTLAGRPVAGLYFGGGTANLSPPGPFRELCRTLAQSFDLSGAEVTLEGVPAAFLGRKDRLVDILRDEFPARHVRLSMGIQTFDEVRLKQMGRLAFGAAATFREVVELAHERGFTASADLLINLPGQSPDAMREDVENAVALGLDGICVYHLVLFEGLGTEWSRDRELVETLPDNEAAARNLAGVRAVLLDRGFVPTTLTNFERRELNATDRRFVYEELSFAADFPDILGFGPSGISFAGDAHSAVKVMNPTTAASYGAAIERGGPPWERAFRYTLDDRKVLHLARRLAALRIERPAYARAFGTDLIDDFWDELSALVDEGLLTVGDGAIEPTPRGLFYADSVAGLFSRKPRIATLGPRRRARRRHLAAMDEGNAPAHM
ncbi:Oxygen-independent coproporphyrinogen-III oxidase [Aquisphaera giovannonii]|uniref:Oxygen-independent coproporphyrinogen-III oxidase n=1 Tax=Aquisphaera giovannonii TaxID=406548 RepID=A0A5B9WDY6_9BACT|nr:radical SAM protein [Aquisphaera giovannonii]QEH38747.1 Oxygen-independent coproporphyrinogen-III oxidase [Aquisphaera giovannonii]